MSYHIHIIGCAPPPRVARQIALHGDIADELIARGYESNRRWQQELDRAVPAHDSVMPERVSPFKALYDDLQTLRRCFSYRLKLARGRLGY